MTNHRVGKTNTKDPRRGWRSGKSYKASRRPRASFDSTVRYLRRVGPKVIRDRLENDG